MIVFQESWFLMVLLLNLWTEEIGKRIGQEMGNLVEIDHGSSQFVDLNSF